MLWGLCVCFTDLNSAGRKMGNGPSSNPLHVSMDPDKGQDTRSLNIIYNVILAE